MITYNFEEYEKMVVELNKFRHKKLLIIGSIVTGVLVALTQFFVYGELLDVILGGIFGTLFFYFIFKYSINKAAKQVNSTNKIIEVKQEILNDRIIEKVLKEQKLENSSELKFADIYRLDEDKNNLYLWINKNAALIIRKDKISNIEDLKQIINKNNLEKKI